jgi:hypothetical protein
MDGFGQLQLIVVNFRSAVLPPLVHAQIDELRRRGLVRLIDSVVASKGAGDDLIILDTLDAPRGDPIWSGVLARSLFGSNTQPGREGNPMPVENPPVRHVPGLGVTEEQLLEVADLIPSNSHALVLLIEHLWMAELDMAAMEAYGQVLASCWISPVLLGQLIRSGHPLFT